MGFLSDLLDNARDKIESKLDAATEYLGSTTIDENIADLKRAGGDAARKIGRGVATAAEYVSQEAPKWQEETARCKEYQAKQEERQYRRDMMKLDKSIRDFEKDVDNW